MNFYYENDIETINLPDEPQLKPRKPRPISFTEETDVESGTRKFVFSSSAPEISTVKEILAAEPSIRSRGATITKTKSSPTSSPLRCRSKSLALIDDQPRSPSKLALSLSALLGPKQSPRSSSPSPRSRALTVLSCTLEDTPPTSPSQPTTPSAKIQMEGFLYKLSKGLLKRWQLRLFQLQGTNLYYSRPGQSRKVSNVLNLSEYVLGDCSSRPHSFTLTNIKSTKCVSLAADTESILLKWKLLISKATNTTQTVYLGKTDEPDIERKNSELIVEGWDEVKKPKTKIEDFDIIGQLGIGSAAKVLLVRDKKSSVLYALKVMKKNLFMQEQRAEAVIKTRKNLQKLSHPFIVRLNTAFTSSSRLYLLLDFHCGGTLATMLEMRTRLSEAHARFYAAEIATALHFIHSHRCSYHDLKPSSVLISKDGHVVLTDFGLFPYSPDTLNFCTTPNYLAPEILLGQISNAVDWWCFGLYCIICYQDPHRIVNVRIRFVFTNQYSMIPSLSLIIYQLKLPQLY
eukprot:NODE_1114_length_2119_cov_47.845691_g941_i0.p1 GENE.NODE_1114_length_2119_cov_47.845691_g941_i0~~NODE_1114_length_2119_cov_47.845691_g941_i0.p1  ORF type:complete len:533 (+),score=52.34 NODE_1114_length_2119_cov_47.845691_g941_i0:56-1600(+)